MHWPWFLPDGKRFLYTARLDDGEGELRLGQLDGGFASECLRASSNAQWIDPDTIVFVREGVLLGQRIDLAPRDRSAIRSRSPSPSTTSSPRPAPCSACREAARWRTTPVATSGSWSGSISSGNEVGTIGAPAEYETPSGGFSRDGTMLLTARRQPELGTYDLWRLDLVRHTEERLTADRGSELTPIWIDDDRAVVYVADSRRRAYPTCSARISAPGSRSPLLPSGPQQLAMDVVPGRRRRRLRGAHPGGETSTSSACRSLRVRRRSLLLRSRQSKLELRISPDGRAMAFLADEEELRIGSLHRFASHDEALPW